VINQPKAPSKRVSKPAYSSEATTCVQKRMALGVGAVAGLHGSRELSVLIPVSSRARKSADMTSIHTTLTTKHVDSIFFSIRCLE
jgi:hypothetical protein